MKNLQNPFSVLDPIAIFGVKTKIKVQLVRSDRLSGGRVWLDNMPDQSVPIAMLAHKVGRSEIAYWERESVAAK